MDINKRFAPPGISPRKEPTQKMRIYASTFSGATEDRLLKETFGRRSLCLRLLPGRRNISQAEALCCGKTGHCGRAAFGVCAVFRFEDARSYAGSWLG